MTVEPTEEIRAVKRDYERNEGKARAHAERDAIIRAVKCYFSELLTFTPRVGHTYDEDGICVGCGLDRDQGFDGLTNAPPGGLPPWQR